MPRRSGKSELVVANRLACSGNLRDAVQQWAFCSLRTSGWAREFYEEHRAKNQGRHAPLRALGNRWLARGCAAARLRSQSPQGTVHRIIVAASGNGAFGLPPTAAPLIESSAALR